MASSCVQRCGSSNKEPFNFAHISIKKENGETKGTVLKTCENLLNLSGMVRAKRV